MRGEERRGNQNGMKWNREEWNGAECHENGGEVEKIRCEER